MLAVTARNLTVPTRLVLNVGVVCAVTVTVLFVITVVSWTVRIS